MTSFIVLGRDLKYGVRQLVRSPAFTAPAILSLALGIAVNSAIFSVVSALLLKPIGPSGNSDLVRIGRSLRGDGSFRSSSHSELLYLRAHASTFSEVFGEGLETLTIAGREGAQVVSAEIVTANYFSVLGLVFGLGRGFSADEDRRPVAVISDRSWRLRFGADPGVIGRPVAVNTYPFTIVGVAPPGFHGTFPGVDIDLWIPQLMVGVTRARGESGDRLSLQLMGRLTPGVSLEEAGAELEALSLQMDRDDPSRERDRGFVVARARGAHPAIANVIRIFMLLLMAIVGVVLLIACANVASLLLARATARRGEFAVRLALGASRSRVFSQLLVESLLLALCGAALGLLLASGIIRAVNRLALASGPTGSPILLDLSLDHRVLWFTAVISVLTAVVFGLAPALQATRVDVLTALKDTRSLVGRRRSRLRGALVMAQVALSVTLLVAAVLLSRSLRHAGRLDLGFEPDAVVVASFNPELPGYDRVKVETFYAELLRRTRLLPGVAHAALAAAVPMSGRGGRASVGLTVSGSTPPEGTGRLGAPYNRVSDDYFATLQQPLLRGRDFTDRDRAGSAPVAIVNQAMAKRFWPNGEALGQRLRLEDEPAEREVIGVVADARHSSFGGVIEPLMYLPVSQNYGVSLTLHVRASGPPARILPDVTRLVREIDGSVAIQDGRTMRESMAFSLFPAEVARSVSGAAGLIALLLASLGLYGLVSYAFEQRIKEIGIRVALGASRRRVMREIAGGALTLAVIGLAIGLGLAAAAMRLFSAFLYGLSPADPFTFGAVAIILLAVTLAAGYAAARKGLNVDPVVALRHE